MIKKDIDNNLTQFHIISSIFILIFFIGVSYLEFIFAEEVIATSPVNVSSIATFEEEFEQVEPTLLAINNETFGNKFSPSQNEPKNEHSNRELSFGFQDYNNEFSTNLNSAIPKVDIPSMPLSLTQLTMDYVTNHTDNNMKTSKNKNDITNHINGIGDTIGNENIPTSDSIISTFFVENTTIAEAQCLMCADLALLQSGGQSQQETVSDALIGNSTNNILNICPSDTPQTGFNATIDATSLNAEQKADVKNAFAECLNNAPDFVPIVVDTTIDSATDGFGNPVENLSSTFSNDINFTFSGTTNVDDELVTERGFVCMLDGGEPFDCTDDTSESFTSSEAFSDLPPGTHTFTVAAFIVVN
ncbi:MAG TPA: hypothetical protein VFZ46_05495 [Nitrososphaeraceae archaeon]